MEPNHLTVGCLTIAVLKLAIWGLLTGVGSLALIVLLNLPVTFRQISGASLVLATIIPVRITFNR